MKDKIRRIFFLGTADYLIIAFFLFTIFRLPTRIFLNADGDILWHMKQGEWIVQNKSIHINRELFSYMFDFREWNYISWLGDVIFYMIHHYFDFLGLYLFTLVYGISLMYYLLRYSIKRGNIIFALTINIAGFYLIASHWFARNHIFGLGFTAMFLMIMEKYWFKESKRTIWIIPVITLIWGQLHGSMIYGIMVVGIYWISAVLEYIYNKKLKVNTDPKELEENIKRLKETSILMLFTFITSLFNQSGFKFYSSLVGDEKLNYFKDFIKDWTSPDIHAHVMFLVLIGITVTIFFKVNKIINIHHVILLLFFGYYALIMGRNMSIFGIVSIIVLTRLNSFPSFKFKNVLVKMISERILYFMDSIKKHEKTRKEFNIIFVVIICIIITFVFTPVKAKIMTIAKLDEDYFPKKAVKYLKDHKITGRFYHSYLVSNYLIWEYFPEKVVFYDTRASIYDLEVSRDYFSMKSYVDFWSKVKKYDLSVFILQKSDIVLIEVLRMQKDKVKIEYEDDNFIIFNKLKEISLKGE